jgi:hypothetical protein
LVSRSSGPVFMFCASELIFGGTGGVRSRFHVLRSRTHFRRFRGRPVPFSCFALPDTFSAERSASGLVFMFCAPGLVFSGNEGAGSRFSCFALPDSFSAETKVSAAVFMFCAPGVISRGTEGVMSHFHVFHARTHIRRYRGRSVSFSCFALPDMLFAVRSASGSVFMFCATGLVFGSTVGVWSCFLVLHSRTRFWAVRRASGPVCMFCVPGFIFGSTEGVGSRFHVLHAHTHFRRYRGRRFPFSCFVRPDSFSMVPRASAPVFMFCASGLVIGNTEGVGSRFHVLRARTHFRRYQGRPVPFSYFALPSSFSAVPRASGPVFMFCTPGLIFDGTERVRSRFYVFYDANVAQNISKMH